jgi:hypothetical protein
LLTEYKHVVILRVHVFGFLDHFPASFRAADAFEFQSVQTREQSVGGFGTARASSSSPFGANTLVAPRWCRIFHERTHFGVKERIFW